MKKMGYLICLSLIMVFCCTGCAKSELKKQEAYERGMNQESGRINRIEAETLNEEALNENLGLKVAEKRENAKNNEENAENVESNVPDVVEIVYVIDTLNNRVHKHNSGCSLLGDESGRATIENWTGTLEEAEAAGYTKCPECILKLGV